MLCHSYYRIHGMSMSKGQDNKGGRGVHMTYALHRY